MFSLKCELYALSAGSAKRDERGRDNGQAGPALAAQPQLVHPGDVRHLGRRPLRRPRLALQPTQERQPLANQLTSTLKETMV